MPRRISSVDNSADMDRWIISYADFITLLFAFFLVMYAMSSINQEKYEEVSVALSDVFTRGSEVLTGEQTEFTGVTAGELLSSDLGAVEDKTITKVGEPVLSELQEKLLVAFDHYLVTDDVSIASDSHWIKIEVGSHLLFESGSISLAVSSDEILESLSVILKQTNGYLLIEGHTDNAPIDSGVLASNWELSALRSANIARILVWHGVLPDKIAVSGYSEYRPLYSNLTAEGRRKNRRVVFLLTPNRQIEKLLTLYGTENLTAEQIEAHGVVDDNSTKTQPLIEQKNTPKGGILFKQADQDLNHTE